MLRGNKKWSHSNPVTLWTAFGNVQFRVTPSMFSLGTLYVNNNTDLANSQTGVLHH